MIVIQSKRKLQFPPASIGYIRMEIDLIQNKPNEQLYILRIVDTCFEMVIEKRLKASVQEELSVPPTNTSTPRGELTEDDYEKVEVEKVLGTNIRFKTYTYEQLRQLSQMLSNVSFANENAFIDNINEVFREGLLLTTQSECMKGISGEGKGMYFSEAQDWERI